MNDAQHAAHATLPSAIQTNNEKAQSHSALEQFLHLQGYAQLLSIRHNTFAHQTIQASDNAIIGDTESGKKKLTLQEYTTHVQHYAPHMAMLMHDHAFDTTTATAATTMDKLPKRLAKAVDRCNKWLPSQFASSYMAIVPWIGAQHMQVREKQWQQTIVPLLQQHSVVIHLGDMSMIAPEPVRYQVVDTCMQHIQQQQRVLATMVAGQDHPCNVNWFLPKF